MCVSCGIRELVTTTHFANTRVSLQTLLSRTHHHPFGRRESCCIPVLSLLVSHVEPLLWTLRTLLWNVIRSLCYIRNSPPNQLSSQPAHAHATMRDVTAINKNNFSLPTSLLRQVAAQTMLSYRHAVPFPHAAFNWLWPRHLIEAVAAEVPEDTDANGCIPTASHCYLRPGTHFRKSELAHEHMGPYTMMLFDTLRSHPFRQFLEQLTGITGLAADPGFEGSGVHISGNAGILKVHHDFNYLECIQEPGDVLKLCGKAARLAALRSRPANPLLRVRMHRRVNVFIYLNPDWPDSYGGHLELWARNLSACQQRIRPSLGRFAVFSSNDFSFHGHPTPMQLPAGRARRSIAFYYYTSHRPAEECEEGDCETFRNAVWKDPTCKGGCNACSGRAERNIVNSGGE